ncbi:hypothetical protein MZK47_05710 [Microbacterium aerolatum]|uniref:hypothetical protein n=1 Tax=Microbacterium aerolatum TaxID=153731 RepID=UPI002000D1CC|nr:hypothetical protein [Microbacterium aerolatum]MCK3769161.1 hypothetical protein [Microbacterium aerolatum]
MVQPHDHSHRQPEGRPRQDHGRREPRRGVRIRPLDTVIHERKAYRDVVGEGLGVVEWSNPKAKTEIQNLAKELVA